MLDMSNMEGMKYLRKSISDILNEYIKIPSFTNTIDENKTDIFFNKQISTLEYFKKHPDYFGQYKINNDTLKRNVNYAMIKGKSKETIVLIHHSDVVNVDNFNQYKAYAFSPQELIKKYEKNPKFLDSETRNDLLSKDWLFGRGVADMKGGGAIQLALFKYYSEINLEPTIILMALPDEENLSAGMRSGVILLEELKEKYDLDYKLMINSEPHQRLTENKAVISQGSIGKLNIFVYVQGYLAHAGKSLEGLNPNALLSKIVCKTDLGNDFIELLENEMSIPPTWIYQRDSKKNYDISFPESALGIMNILNFSSNPRVVLKKIISICEKEMEDYIDLINDKRRIFAKKTNRNWLDFDWESSVLTFSQLKERLKDKELINKKGSINELIHEYLVELNINKPVIIVGLLPPYYPGVTNSKQKVLLDLVNDFSLKSWHQVYDNRAFFTGISDLSYATSLLDYKAIEESMDNMIGWKDDYYISFESIKKISMPCVNIGPWGKDFHRSTERVYKEDLYERTPLLINFIIKNWRELNV